MAAEMWPRPRGHPEGKFLFFRNCGSLCPGVVEEESVSTVTVINSRANMDHVPLLISRFPALISLRTLVMAPAITAATHCRSPKMQDNQEGPQRCKIIRKVPKTCHSQELELFQFPLVGAGAKSGSKQPPQILQSPGHPDQRGSIMWCLLVTAGIS